ncbi:MAG: hypothetical protein NDJ65_02125 [Paludibacteraceae bacterium]|nr:hypothetical protein [Paludibacteraceae bacterium]
MKKMIAIVLFATSISLFANDNPDYKPGKSFNNDSISYLKENFDNSEYYVGKPLKCLFDDLEIQIRCSDFYPAFFGDKKLRSAVFYFEASRVVSKAIILEKRSKALVKMHVFFEPVDKRIFDEYDLAVRGARNRKEVNDDSRWEMFDKGFLENFIITKISVPDVVR